MLTTDSTHSHSMAGATGAAPAPRRLATGAVATAGLAATGVPAAFAAASVEELIERIRSSDDAVRGPAWQGAAAHGTAAVRPLAGLFSDPDFEVGRAARRALWVIVRHVGRPGAERERRAVARELVALLGGDSTAVRREALWMLSEIAEEEAIPAMGRLLAHEELREDARAALLRLPGRQVSAQLQAAFASAPEDFKYALADALRRRGQRVRGYPSRKLVPTRETTVAPGAST